MAKYIRALALLFTRPDDEPIKIGIVGLDTSHVVAFTQLLNDTKGASHVPGAKVVCAFKGGSDDIKDSFSRVEGFTKTLQEKWGVEIVDSIETLCKKVDAVLLESVDGRQHLEQVRPVFAAKKRVFIDKPLAGSLKDAREIANLSRQSGVPFFSCSSQRFAKPIQDLKHDATIGKVEGAFTFGPMPIETYLPDL